MLVLSSNDCRYGPNVPASLSPTMYTEAGFVGRRRAGVSGAVSAGTVVDATVGG